MHNKLTDLNNYLFEQIEKLNDSELESEQFDKEIKRAAALSKIAGNIVDNAALLLNAKKLAAEYGLERKEIPELLSDGNSKSEQ